MVTSNPTAAMRRLSREETGTSLIELLVVLLIIGILLAIAVPSYLGFKDHANDATAKANIRSAVPAVEAYYADNGTFVGMDLAALRTIDGGIAVDTVGNVGPTTFCIDATVDGKSWNKAGPAVALAAGTCS